ARSNSGSSISTLRRTRFPSRGSAVARITSGPLYRAPRSQAHGGNEPSEHEIHGREDAAADGFVARQRQSVSRLEVCRSGPPAAKAHEIKARQRQRDGRRRGLCDVAGEWTSPATID